VIACLIAGCVATTLVQSYAQLKQATVHSQAELEAIGIAQECVDQLRVQQFVFLQTNLGTHNVTIVGASPTGDNVFPRPLLRDTSLTFYNNTATQTSDLYNYIHAVNNQATVTLTQDPNTADAIDASVLIKWNDGQYGLHSYTINTILSSSGLNG
jgi:hypothetical protein